MTFPTDINIGKVKKTSFLNFPYIVIYNKLHRAI